MKTLKIKNQGSHYLDKWKILNNLYEEKETVEKRKETWEELEGAGGKEELIMMVEKSPPKSKSVPFSNMLKSK
ncbi:unnamed protein product [Spirodela intermedia]|uniref:Uncharacterized protein n=1 Tax=Spirodela intermedia TaxID=51605 RepID=A0A7I8JUB5_SPIIN|nr:unnamed protein product [Spirodela intermedia]CAA6673797.1 unnamed protein product [Spirodela intermedia]